MSKKEKVKKFFEEHKEDIKGYAILIGSTALLTGTGIAVGRSLERHRCLSNSNVSMALQLNKESNNTLVQGNLETGLGKLSDIGDIVTKGLKEANVEGHLDDTVIGYMVYVKDKIKS